MDANIQPLLYKTTKIYGVVVETGKTTIKIFAPVD